MSTKRALRFSIVLRSPDYSWVGKRAQTAFGGTSSVVVPHVPMECICCSVSTQSMQVIPIHAYRGRIEKPMQLPVCAHCSDHAVLRIRGMAEAVLGVTAALLAGGVVIGVLASLWWLALSCLAPCAGLVILFRRQQVRRLDELGAAGHAAGISVRAEPFTLHITTGNRRLAKSLLALNPTAALDHPHERFLYDSPLEQKPPAPVASSRPPRAVVLSAPKPPPPADQDGAPRFLV